MTRWNALHPHDEHSPLIVPAEDLRALEADARDAGEASMQAAFWRARAIELGASEDEWRKRRAELESS